MRVPRPEPDLVTDIEAAVDYLTPSDTEDLTTALLLGDKKAHVVPTHPFRDLMQRRVEFDDRQARELRQRLSPGAHLTYRAPGDPRKTIRLGLRLHCATVSALSDEELASWSTRLGPDLQAGKLAGVRAVYLVADKDDVRLDADLFLQDLRERERERADRHAMAEQLAARQVAAAPPTAASGPTRPTTVAHAPLRGIGDATSEEPASATPTAGVLEAIQQALEAAGFDVLVAPKTKHLIDLAAERDEGDVQRVIVRVPDRLTLEVAQDVLATCRAVDTDLALIVCDETDPAARKRLIATKVRWVQPTDLAHLML